MSRTVGYLRYSSIAVSMILIGSLALVVIGILSSLYDPVWDQTVTLHDWRGSTTQTILYALGSTLLQVVIGTLAAWALFYLGSVRRICFLFEALVLSMMMVIYCMQPVVVWHVIVDLFSLPSRSLSSLIIATGWQYAPFVTFFTLLFLKAIPTAQHELCSVESPWSTARIRMTFFPALATLVFSLACVRFAWNATKFELPFRFQRGGVVLARNVLAVRLGLETQFRAQLYWGLILMVAIIAALSVFALILRTCSRLRDWGQRSRGRVGRRRRGVLQIITVMGAGCLLLYVFTFAYVSFDLLRLPTSNISIEWQSVITSLVFATFSALLATAISLVIVYSYSRTRSTLTCIWTQVSKGIVAIPLVLIGALAFRLTLNPWNEQIAGRISALPGFSVVWFAPLLSAIRVVPALVAYVLFLTPLVFPVVQLHYLEYLPLEREELPQADGRRRGLRLFAHAVFPALLPIIGLTTFLAFSIVLQDLSVARWFVNGNLKLLSYELLSLERSDSSGFVDMLRFSYTLTVIQGLVFIGVYSKIPVGGVRQ